MEAPDTRQAELLLQEYQAHNCQSLGSDPSEIPKTLMGCIHLDLIPESQRLDERAVPHSVAGA
jgi:hypothetical protein